MRHSSYRTPPGRRRTAAVGASLLAAALMFVSGLFAGVGGSGAGASAAAPSAGAAPAILPAVEAHLRGLPGSSPHGQRSVDVPALALAALRDAPARPPPPPTSHPLPGPPTEAPSVHVAVGGTITGRVYDLIFGQPIVGATVRVTPFSVSTCLPVACYTNLTGPGGTFSVPGPTGPDTIQVTAPDYVGNQTWTVVANGGTDDVGFIYLLHDGYATGIVEDDTPDHQGIANVTVNATSRSGLVTTGPAAVTVANGSFTVAVPPLPSQLTFTPSGTPSPYFQNFTWTNVTPYHTVNLGIIRLEGGVPVVATLYDQATGRPIANGTPTQLTVCTRRADICAYPILNHTGPGPLNGWAMPGPASVSAFAVGYLVNTTTVPDIPNSATTVDLGRINLLPLAAVELSTNLTGGSSPPGGWPAGNVTAFVCSLDGLSVTLQLSPGTELLESPCWPRGVANASIGNTYPIGSTTLAFGAPLRDAVFIVPASVGPPEIPIATTGSFSPTPLFPSTYANVTWVNLTPDEVTDIGSVDIAAGTYVQGNVSLRGFNGSEDGAFQVEVCSTDATTDCGAPVLSSDLEPPVVGCASGPGSFCAPAPAGPDRLTLTELGPGVTNYTWFTVPGGCCGQSGHPTSVGTIDISFADPYGALAGNAIGRLGGYGSAVAPPGGIFGTVQACPAIPSLPGQAIPSCTFGSLDPDDGEFNLSAPIGWDQITVQAFDYESNWTWIDETGNNQTGTIELQPNGYFTGFVLSGAGGGVDGAIVQACPVGAPTQCFSLAAAGTNGEYNGSLPALPFIGAAYEITASYPGWITSWTWVNATPNDVVHVPTIVLPPIAYGARPMRSLALTGAANVSEYTWVTGRVVDHRTGLGVPGAFVAPCYAGNCFTTLGYTTDGGTFNFSLDTGNLTLLISAGDYAPAEYAVAPSTAPEEDLGVLYASPDPWVSGRVLIAPWESTGASLGLGAPAELRVCLNISSGTQCALEGTTNTAGSFNVSGPAGSDLVLVQGMGIDSFGSALGGFDPQQFYFNLSGSYATTPGPYNLSIFGGLLGQLTDSDASSVNGTAPAPFAQVSAFELGQLTGSSTSAATGPDGEYTLLLPPGGAGTNITGTSSAFMRTTTTVNGSVAGPGFADVPALPLTHFGWVTAEVVNVANGSPLAFATVSTVTTVNAGNVTGYSSAATANGAGFVNLSVAPSHVVGVAVGAPDFLPQNFVATVRPSGTTGLGTVRLTDGFTPGGFVIRSPEVNTVGAPPTIDVLDPAANLPIGAPLAGAALAAVSPIDGSFLSSTVHANGLGQFLLWVNAPSPSVDLDLTIPSYDPLSYFVATANATDVVVPHLNTTGAGVVAGRIVAVPGKFGVYDLPLLACPYGNIGCATETEGVAYTNITGDFWIAATRGFDQLTFESEQYLTNVTPTASVLPDGFIGLGDVPVYVFGNLTGTVRGVPSGALLGDANISLCSIFGTPFGPCVFAVNATSNGTFDLSAPPSTYVLVVRAPGYNLSYQTITLLPGAQFNIGTILLLADGSVSGTAVTIVTGGPAPNATAFACAVDSTGDCSAVTNASANGSFSLIAPPGPDLLTVSSPEFFDNYTDVLVPSGGTINVGRIVLAPFSIAIPESVSGTVVASNGTPLVGVLVALQQGTVSVVSGVTQADGAFTLATEWGTYDLVAVAPGYVATRVAFLLHSNLTGVVVTMPTMTYEINGTVTDAATRAALAGVTIALGSTTLAVAGPTGAFGMSLPNGTYDLVATAPNGSSAAYAPLPFSVRVAGADVLRNVTLTPTRAVLTGEVVDANSGLPIAGATLVLWNSSGTLAARTTSALTGAFSLALAPGTYWVNATAAGYGSANVTVLVPSPQGPVTIPLAPVALGSFTSTGLPTADLLLLAGVAAAVVIAVALVARRRPPPSDEPAAARWTLDAPDEFADPAPAATTDGLSPGPERWTIEDLDEPGVENTTGPGR